MAEKLLGDTAVALDRCGYESFLILKMLSDLSRWILSRSRRNVGFGTSTLTRRNCSSCVNAFHSMRRVSARMRWCRRRVRF